MGVFTYVYYSSLIREHHVTVGSILQMIVSGLTVDEQLELIVDLKRYLEGQGILVAWYETRNIILPFLCNSVAIGIVPSQLTRVLVAEGVRFNDS